MNMKNIPGRLTAGCEVDPGSGDIYMEDGSLVAEAFVNGGHKSRARNARRLAACWNACDGIKTEDLERYYSAGYGIDQAIEERGLSDHANAIKQRDELLEALQEFVRNPGGDHTEANAIAAIEKAIGKSATPVNYTAKLHRAGSFGGAE